MQNKRLVKLLKLKQERPQDPFVAFAIAQELHRSGNIEEAVQAYQKLLENKADYLGAYYHLGKALEETNKPAEARVVYLQGIEYCQLAKDQHSLSELQQALMLVEDAC